MTIGEAGKKYSPVGMAKRRRISVNGRSFWLELEYTYLYCDKDGYLIAVQKRGDVEGKFVCKSNGLKKGHWASILSSPIVRIPV